MNERFVKRIKHHATIAMGRLTADGKVTDLNFEEQWPDRDPAEFLIMYYALKDTLEDCERELETPESDATDERTPLRITMYQDVALWYFESNGFESGFSTHLPDALHNFLYANKTRFTGRRLCFEHISR